MSIDDTGGPGRRAPALAGALALALAHGAATAETPPGSVRFVCAHYDAERAGYTGAVAVLEPAGDAAPEQVQGTATHRLLVLAVHEDAPHAAPQAQALSAGEALALLANAQRELRAGRAVREESLGRIAHDRERHRLRFSGAGARPRTMTVFTVPGLAIVESGAARGRRGDGAYRCAQPPRPPRALLPAHCAERRAGRVDLDAFPAPRTEVRLIQSALERAGMAPGPIDGIFGPRTLAALERWTGRTGRGPGRILAYETLCPLIAPPPARRTRRERHRRHGTRSAGTGV